jgi:peptidoglycan/xylan/chitin deacetylase (PgdA/CDA1 family)
MSTRPNIRIYRSGVRSNEKDYVLNFIFKEVLGLELTIIDDTNSYRIELENGNVIIIEDHFFDEKKLDNELWSLKNFPAEKRFAKNQFIPESDIPVLYGTGECIVAEMSITLKCDIIASIFFMLTRWEEYAHPTRDAYNRFPLTESIAYKWGFFQRPIVNEYIEMIWNMLVHMGMTGERNATQFELLLTHDVDDIRRWDTLKKCLSSLAGDVIRRKNIPLAFSNCVSLLKVLFGKEKDPYDTFDYMMDISDKYGVKSHFFFMAGGDTPHDRRYDPYDPRIITLMKHIKERGHAIGIHPSYDTYNNSSLFLSEVQKLRDASHSSITMGRQHYLRFEAPKTWQLWNDQGLEWDSTLGYAEAPGFRAGYCNAFPVFNFLTREPLTLIENPLMIMDVSLTSLKYQEVESIVQKVKKYNGKLVFLWHNSNYSTIEWQDAKKLYEEIIEKAVS